MQTKISSKGQVVVPLAIRNELQIKAGDYLEAQVEKDYVKLIPKKRRKFRTWVGKSRVTGLPVIMSEPDAPKITNEMVAKLLQDFP